MASIKSLTSSILDIPPSCVAFCPSRPEIFVVGTYFLHPRNTSSEQNTSDNEDEDEAAASASAAPQKRTGTLITNKLIGTEVTLLQTEPLESAVLDIEWSPHENLMGDLLCVATSTGSLIFYQLQSTTNKLQRTSTFQICSEETLVLDLVWHPSHVNVIGVTLSDGAVILCKSTNTSVPWTQGATITTHPIHEHSLEPWTIAFSPDHTSLLTGGDDIVLQSSRIEDFEAPMPVWQDRRLHQAGVTAILPLSDDLIVTGGYDDRIRLISAPAAGGMRQALAEEGLGGGVWRLKLLGQASAALGETNGEAGGSTYTILASCMHAGTRIVRLSRQKQQQDDCAWHFDVLAKFEEHESMNYGTDVQPCAGSLKTVISTSFYDRLMCVWQFDVA